MIERILDFQTNNDIVQRIFDNDSTFFLNHDQRRIMITCRTRYRLLRTNELDESLRHDREKRIW
jgi:hypothetical protein